MLTACSGPTHEQRVSSRLPTVRSVDLSMYAGLLIPAIAVSFMLISAVVDLVGWRKANRRAEDLLRSVLSPAELDQLDRCGYLDVPSSAQPGRLYRVPAQQELVKVIEKGSIVQHLCIRTAQHLPGREHVVAHKLLIEASEREYLRRANVAWQPRSMISAWPAPE